MYSKRLPIKLISRGKARRFSGHMDTCTNMLFGSQIPL